MDANIAAMAGFKKPILHGLCSLGFSTRHVLQTYAAGDPTLFKSIKVAYISFLCKILLTLVSEGWHIDSLQAMQLFHNKYIVILTNL